MTRHALASRVVPYIMMTANATTNDSDARYPADNAIPYPAPEPGHPGMECPSAADT